MALYNLTLLSRHVVHTFTKIVSLVLKDIIYLVVSTHLKNISQIGSFPQVGVKIKNSSNHHLVIWYDFMNQKSRHLFLKTFDTTKPGW